jgi:nucleobindin
LYRPFWNCSHLTRISFENTQHEEIYHNTPETQTEEAYSHPEDIAHFAAHEEIEAHEEELIRKAMGDHAQEIFDAPIPEE